MVIKTVQEKGLLVELQNWLSKKTQKISKKRLTTCETYGTHLLVQLIEKVARKNKYKK